MYDYGINFLRASLSTVGKWLAFFLSRLFVFRLLVAVFASGAQEARSQIESSGRFATSINGGSAQSRISRVCAISGGTDVALINFIVSRYFDRESNF